MVQSCSATVEFFDTFKKNRYATVTKGIALEEITYYVTGMTMNRPFAPVLDRLNMAGLRPTRQRMALARLLFDSGDRHVTAEQLHQQATHQGVKVSLATVYNTLNQFTASGLLREVAVDARRSYFDTNTDPHHHFFNQDTAELTDISGTAVAVSKLPDAPAGTVIDSVDVIIRVRSN
tara:strand:+ start:493 stop:1023 length:531 start_codon:yes stop_codon:yes gene_type:complete